MALAERGRRNCRAVKGMRQCRQCLRTGKSHLLQGSSNFEGKCHELCGFEKRSGFVTRRRRRVGSAVFPRRRRSERLLALTALCCGPARPGSRSLCQQAVPLATRNHVTHGTQSEGIWTSKMIGLCCAGRGLSCRASRPAGTPAGLHAPLGVPSITTRAVAASH